MNFDSSIIKIVSNGGNLFGSLNAKKQESLSDVSKALSMDFSVLINLWTQANSLWIGPLLPRYEMFPFFLEEFQKDIYVQAEDYSSLVFCLKKGYKCFSSNFNSVTLTSGGEMVLSANDAKFVLEDLGDMNQNSNSKDRMKGLILLNPEYGRKTDLHLNQYDIYNRFFFPQTIITDFPILLRFALNFGIPSTSSSEEEEEEKMPQTSSESVANKYIMSIQDIWNQGLTLDDTYDEILKRQPPICHTLPPSFDVLKDSLCIAVFSDLVANSKLLKVSKTAQNLFNQRNNVVFTQAKQRLDYQGCLHFTHMQLVSFKTFQSDKMKEFNLSDIIKKFEDKVTSIERSEDLKLGNVFSSKPKIISNNRILSSSDKPYICFHRVLKSPCGIMLVGYPNFPILEWRNQMRKICLDERSEFASIFSEPEHKQNIVHSTLVRFLQPPSDDVVNECIKMIQAQLPIKVKLGPRKIAVCNYLMDESIARDYGFSTFSPLITGSISVDLPLAGSIVV